MPFRTQRDLDRLTLPEGRAEVSASMPGAQPRRVGRG
jgi:hypothetical protein